MSSPLTPLVPAAEPDYEEEVQSMKEYYDSIKAQDIDPIGVGVVSEPDQGVMATMADIGNLMMGDTFNSVGVQLDKEGFHFDIEKGKDFWAEHPVRATLGFATVAASALGVVSKLKRVERLTNITDDMLRDTGYLADDVNPALLAEHDRELMRVNLDHAARYNENNAAYLDKGGAASPKEKAFYAFQKYFANAYAEDTGPRSFDVRKEWRKSVQNLLGQNGPISKYFDGMPGEEIAPLIGRYLADSTKLDDIPAKHRPWAMMLADDLRATQREAVEEGMIFQSESAHVGDLWFPTTNETTKLDLGEYTSILSSKADGSAQMVKVPRTSSPNLLRRAASKEDVKLRVEKQYAAELLSSGKREEAVSLLQGEKYADVRGLLDEGDTQGAIRALTTNGKIDFRPESLTFNGVFNQKLQLANFRMLRDLAMNPDIVKPSTVKAAMSPLAQRGWMSLDTLDNADRIRNMIAIKRGVDPNSITELGWVPKSVFRELREIHGGPKMTSAASDFMNLLTSIYKTNKTAMNPASQVTNIVGNYGLLINAGVNPFSGEFKQLMGTSSKAIWGSMKAARRRELTTDVGKLGTLDSLVGGKKINIADEMASTELSELIELQSIQAAEGVGVVERFAKGNPEDFTTMIAKAANKAYDTKVPRYLADQYLAADAIPKMAYFLHLRQRGFSRASATMEVARRLPMYSTAGGFVQGTRKALFPWITFPTEIARIMKNNLMDHPLKTAMMMQMPGMLQVGAYLPGAAGLGPRMSAESIRDRKEQLATWANRPSTIMSPIRDRNGDFRAMTLDFLPYTAVMPPTVSKDAPLFKKMPFGMDEPMPILSGLWLAMTGKDAWGREVPTDPDNPTSKMAQMSLQFMNFIAPPWMSRYLFDPSQAEFGYKFLQEAGKAVNPYTEKAGDPVFDMLVNNLSPVKMYPSNPEQQIANESFYRSQLQTWRGKLSKEWNALLKSGHTEGAAEKMKEIMSTFEREFKEPDLVGRKQAQWLESQKKRMRSHPQLRSFTEEDLKFRAKQLEAESGPIRTRARQQLIDAYRKEISKRGRSSQGGTKNPFLPSWM